MNVTRRTCGYLGENFWNVGKTKEIKCQSDAFVVQSLKTDTIKKNQKKFFDQNAKNVQNSSLKPKFRFLMFFKKI